MVDESAVTQTARLERIRQAQRVCFFGHFHQNGIVAQYVLDYLGAIAKAGFSIVFTTTCVLQPTEVEKVEGTVDLFIARENVGLDFGGWAVAYAATHPLTAELLLLTNDSVYFLRDDLDGYLWSLLQIQADFYGAVESFEGSQAHIQSWFVLLKPKAYNSNSIKMLFGNQVADGGRFDLIDKYELGLTKGLVAEGLSYYAAYRPSRSKQALIFQSNLTHHLWMTLLAEEKCPFLKVDLLRRNPLNVAGLGDWQHACSHVPTRILRSIEKDLEMRGTTAATTFLGRLAASLNNSYPQAWPELHSFIARDYRLRSWPRSFRSANVIAYRLARKLSGLLRYRIRSRNSVPFLQ